MSLTATASQPELSLKADRTSRPYVIVGNGPVGMRAARDLLDRLPDAPIVIYGEEQHEPYNRVRLSSWLAGDVDWQQLAQPLEVPPGANVEQRIGYRVHHIDREHCTITDNTGLVQAYRKLILATGSSPFIPGIPGVNKQGVFTFRDLDDTTHLIARRARSHRTVILGGGLLGLEAARGMQRSNTHVTVVEHADRLLGNQLDESGSRRLQTDVEALGIDVVIGDGAAEVTGDERVTGVRLHSARHLACDTLIIATGIRPNIDLAKQAGLAFGRGIRVDDQMRTTDPHIYAIGECAEHRGQIYGLVAPGLEQAAVATADIAVMSSHYIGSVTASRLKVVGTPVFSMGPMGAGESAFNGREHVYRDDDKRIYRKILVSRNRLIGAIGIGDWSETVRLQTSIGQSLRLWPWQIMRFVRTGMIWPAEDSQGVAAWPANALVCQCTGVSRGSISEAVSLGACSLAQVSRTTGASTVCGSCRPLVQELLGRQQAEPAPMHRLLTGIALLTALVSALVLFGPRVPYADSVQHAWQWDVLWRDGLAKQVTGFSVLGLFIAGLLVSLRKRTRLLDRAGRFDAWRLAHTLLGSMAIAALILHTGLRLGNGLNLLLMLSFSVMLLLGAISTGVIAQEHRIGGALARRLRQRNVLAHILMFWPVPPLLGWHVFKTYWY